MDKMMQAFMIREFRFVKIVTAILVTFLLIYPPLFRLSEATKTDTCEYDLDLASQKVKITCQGSPSMINVFANKALMQVDEYDNVNNFRENTHAEHVTNVNKQRPYSASGFPGSDTVQPETFKMKYGNSEQQREAPERMRFSEESNAAQSDWEEIVSRHDGWFAGLVVEVSERLQRAKQNLSHCGASIRNISNQLSQGDINLRPDMENLRRGENSVTDLTQGIIRALRNQYNFMSNAFLSRTYELQKLALAMTMLVDVTADGLNSTLTAHKMVTDEVATLRDYLSRLQRRASKGISRYNRLQRQEATVKSDQCPKRISAIGQGTMTRVQWATGSFMVESPANASRHRSVFILPGTGPATQLRQYFTMQEVEHDLVGRYLELPKPCSGTGHAVYRRHLYCHVAGSNLIMKYHLKRRELISELALPGAMVNSSLPDKSGTNTDIDLAVDELGLWAIYGNTSDGNIVITKINPMKMEILNTFETIFPRPQFGNSFMICGVLYVTNSHVDTPTYIRYVFNTETKEKWELTVGELPFGNSALLGRRDEADTPIVEKFANSVMLSYDHRDSSLYSWNAGRIEVFPVYFKS